VPTIHKVLQGEHLASIAAAYGFENFETLWNHPQNASLRQSRENPLALLPGDEVFVPDLKPARFSLQTGKRHSLTVHTQQLSLRLRVLDLRGEPLRDTPCVLSVGAMREELTTDGDGCVELRVEPHETQGTLSIAGLVFELALGGLDPVPEPTGLAGRLSNLGYPVEDPRQQGPDSQEWMRFALELFQRDNALDITGAPDVGIPEQLVEKYGC
jgi:hypothetical protein